ncbi:type I methionyl aminopeptidase [Holzapfeliella sp. He02]|uniref:Methionine aminopeptidase n=1 Tax=Holzapfeliella saturejae TaxID=3082953 RepID=A0ABU8SH66_9LACO
MITLKSRRELEGMAKSGQLLAQTHLGIKKLIKPGISLYEIEEFADNFITENGGIPSEKGFEGYKYATCVSVNDEIAHATPRKDVFLKEGDVVSVDMTINLDGYESDSCWTYAVGEISKEDQDLMDIAHKALYLGIDQAQVGNRIGDIGYAIQQFTEVENNYGDVRELIGHGIQPTMHEEPEVPHFGKKGRGLRLKEGMTITIEPMITQGSWEMVSRVVDDPDDDWVYYVTEDGSKCAQYEHTIAITADGPKILTSQDPEFDKNYLFK